MILNLKELTMLDRYSMRDDNIEVGDKIIYNKEVHWVIDIAANELVIGNEDASEGFLVRYEEIFKPIEWSYDEIAKRVADDIFPEAYEVLKNKDLVPAGRILNGAGSGKNVTYFNCYVMPFIPDSREGISDHRKQVMEIMSRAGGVGTNGSTLRPPRAKAKGVGGTSSGAVSWLNDLTRLTHLVKQGGSRRGAQMIMLADWHPEIIDFISCKVGRQSTLDKINKKYGLDLKVRPENTIYIPEDPFGKHKFMSGANISIAISHDFMKALENDEMWQLRFPDIDNYNKDQMAIYDNLWKEIGDVREWQLPIKTYEEIPARMLWDIINICAHDSGEPGLFFIDNANDMTNAKSYGQKVICTNPCGEQPLAPYSVCNLAAINLANMVDKNTGAILWNKLRRTVELAVEFCDNVIDKTYYFLEKNKEQALNERRVGLGVMGLHDLLLWTGLRYGSQESLELIDWIFDTIKNTAYMTSSILAKKKGVFPLYNKEFVNGVFIGRLNKNVIDSIKENGIRNSHLLTIAPTGTTGTMVGVSTGLEPYFALQYYRSGRLGTNIKVDIDIVKEYMELYNFKRDLPEYFIGAMDVTAEEHIAVQSVIQYHIDSSISKTINAPAGTTVDEVSKMYMELYRKGAKGGTVYVDGSREEQVLHTKQTEQKCELCGGKLEQQGGCMTCTSCGAQTACGI